MTQNKENGLLTHTTSCAIMILRFVFVPVKAGKKFLFRGSPKEKL